MGTAADILRFLADLAPRSGGVTFDVTTAYGPFVWLGVRVRPGWIAADLEHELQGASIPATVGARRLAGLDAMHRHERLLRIGWVFLAGSADIDGERRRLCLPLASRPVRLVRMLRGFMLAAAGDLELTPLVTDPAAVARLEPVQFGGGALDGARVTAALLRRLTELQRWIRESVASAGLAVDEVLVPREDPRRHRERAGLVAVVGAGLYAARDVAAVDVGTTLRAWARLPGLDETAFGAVTGTAPDAHDDSDAAEGDMPLPPSPLPVSEPQQQVLHRTRTAPVTVVSGAPGNGKSHAVVAAAIDAVASGRSVLIATQTQHAGDVLSDLLGRYPGPVPVTFGSSERRSDIAARLSAGLPPEPSRREIHESEHAVERAAQQVRSVEAVIRDLLTSEQLAADAERLEPTIPAVAHLAPGLFDPATDLGAARDLLDRTERSAPRLLGRWRRARAERRLRRIARADPSLEVGRLRLAVDAARARRARMDLEARGGTTIGALWDELDRVDRSLADAAGTAIDLRARRISTRGRRAVAELANALRAGRGRRREVLQRMDGHHLTRALPLWIGTLRDVEDLLPRAPGVFDLVILDEASQIDQHRAAGALLRARSAIVAGDPQQLRHVSFVADLDVAAALDEHGLSAFGDRLDVRRTSAFDLAASAAPVIWLDEHYRSVPHLIGFSARRFYVDPIRPVTSHPRNEALDAIDVVRVEGVRDDDGVNRTELQEVEAIVAGLHDDGVTSVGVVTPFRAHADALEERLLERFDLDGIERLGLRAGTVHAFQGNERDVVVVSLAVGPDEPPATRRFVEDPHLFNVMITRARLRLIVVTSIPREGRGLLHEYLRYSEGAPSPPRDRRLDDPWTHALRDRLRGSATTVRAGYPVGRWVVDLVVGDGGAAVGVETRVHPAGVAAHIERHRTLTRFGWELTDAFPTRFAGDPASAAIALTTAARREQ